MLLLDGNWNMQGALSLIQTILTAVTCFLAICIPEKIKWEQRYSQLLSDYRGHDFGAAVMGITLFFYKQCKNSVDAIQSEYVKTFKKQFYNQLNQNTKEKQCNLSNNQKLHFQRRLLTQFYWDLDQCANSFYIGKKRIQKDFSSKEANLLKVVYYMNEATASPEIYMDITTDDRLTPNPQSINKYIRHIYTILKKAKPYIR